MRSVPTGALRHLVTLQRPAGRRDAVGERVTTWNDVASARAEVSPISAREQFAAAQAHSGVTHRVTLRWTQTIAGIEASWRLKFGARNLVIEGVRNLEERNQWLELLCSEGLRSE